MAVSRQMCETGIGTMGFMFWQFLMQLGERIAIR